MATKSMHAPKTIACGKRSSCSAVEPAPTIAPKMGGPVSCAMDWTTGCEQSTGRGGVEV